MAEYLLGIDRGTTNVKAVLFDLDGNEVKKASRASGEIRRPFPGWNEQDMDLIWTRTREAIHDLFDEDIRPEDVIAVGVCGQGNGVFLIDGCIFRSNSSTDSGANRPPIPIESIH